MSKAQHLGNISFWKVGTYIRRYGIHVLREYSISPYGFTSTWIINLDQVINKLFVCRIKTLESLLYLLDVNLS